MGGYRENHFEPGACEQPGALVKPFNAVQWSGIALIFAGAAALLAIAAGRFRWLPRLGNTDLAPFIPLTAVGSVLVNAGRQPATDLAPNLTAERRRWMLIVVTICAALFSAAILIDIARS